MSYSDLAKAVLLGVALSACAHGAQPAANTSTAAEASAPRFKRLHATFLAGEARRVEVVHGGEVVAEGVTCDPWSGDAAERCDLSQLATESVAGGLRHQP